MKLSSRWFWEVDENEVSLDKDAAFIIPRVFQYGKLDDFFLIKKYYGLEKLQNTLLATVHRCSVYLQSILK